MRLPLEGLTVIDLTEVWAGPMATSLLGDLGARVIKIESFPRASITRIPGGPATRGYANNDATAPRPWDRAAIHNMANRNKYCVTLNLTHPKGVEVFKRIVPLADVLAEAFSVGTMEKLGIGYDTLKGIRPDLIMVSMPGWGSDGPYKGYVSLGSSLDGFTGHHILRGYPDTDASYTGVVQHPDAIGAVTLPFSVLVALHNRNRTGEGQWIDISQAESFIPHLSRSFMDSEMNGRDLQLLGNRDYYMAPHGCYRCLGEDSWVVHHRVFGPGVGGTLPHHGRPPVGPGREVRPTPLSRHRYQDDLDGHIQEWTLSRDKMEIMHLLQEAGVPAQAVMDDVDIYSDPHLEARGFFERVSHPVHRRVPIPRPPVEAEQGRAGFQDPPGRAGRAQRVRLRHPAGDERRGDPGHGGPGHHRRRAPAALVGPRLTPPS